MAKDFRISKVDNRLERCCPRLHTGEGIGVHRLFLAKDNGARVFDSIDIRDSERTIDYPVLFHFGEDGFGMFSADAVIEAQPNHLKFVHYPAVLNSVFKIALERGYLCWVEHWQELLAAKEVVPIHVEIRFTIDSVFLPSDFKEFIDATGVGRAKDNTVNVGTFFDGERRQIVLEIGRDQFLVIRQCGSVNMVVVIRTLNFLLNGGVVPKPVER